MNKTLLLLLSLTATSAFVTPFAGVRRASTPTHVLSEPMEETEEPAVDDVAPVVAEEEEKPPRHTLFVGNLPFSADIRQVKEIFAEAGQVGYVNIPKHFETGQTRGFAFVDMATPEECEKAIETLDGLEVEGRNIRVSKSEPGATPAKKKKKKFVPEAGTAKLYVGNLSFDTTNEQLQDYFGEFGNVIEVYMPTTPEGGPRGFCFVTLKEEDLDATIEATNGVEFMGRNLVVSIPLPPGERTARSKKTKIYVGNLSFYTSADTIAEVFSEFGEVHDVFLPEDANTGNPRGFGFVTMDVSAAEEAIFELDGMELDGRPIRVNEAMSKGQKQQRKFDDDDDEESF